jgi:hypothetical protein
MPPNKSRNSKGQQTKKIEENQVFPSLGLQSEKKIELLYNIGDIVKIKETGDLGIVTRTRLLGNNLNNKVIVKVNNIIRMYSIDEISSMNI